MQRLRRLGVICALTASLLLPAPLPVGATEGRDTREIAAVTLAAPHPAPSGAELTLLELTNAERARHKLAPVELDPPVIDIARARAAAQLIDGPLSHHDGTGGLAFVGLMAESGLGYRLAGENLARWVADDPAGPERVQRALMDSPTHRENILEPTFNRLAIGAAIDDRGRIAFAEIFRAAP